MKMVQVLLMSVMSTVFAVQSFADETIQSIRPRTSLSFVSGSVSSVETNYIPVCPQIPGQISCLGMISETQVTLEIPVSGCFDSIGPVGAEIVADIDGVKAIVVSAVRIADKRSLVAICSELPVERRVIKIQGYELSEQEVKDTIRFVK